MHPCIHLNMYLCLYHTVNMNNSDVLIEADKNEQICIDNSLRKIIMCMLKSLLDIYHYSFVNRQRNSR